MIAPATFVKHKFDSDSLKTLFTAKDKSAKIQKLITLLAERNKDGMDRALKDYRTWAAVDLAYDAPFRQETPTLISHILSTNDTADAVRKAAKSWGVPESALFCDCGRKDASGNAILDLNPPAFAEIHIPITRSYTTVRTAKIFNDRNLTPLFPFEPLVYTAQNRIRCEIITNAVQQMASHFGWSATLRQMILQDNLYSVCVMFPMEPWYSEKQEDESGKEITLREGIRYVTPHITRLFWDLQHPLSTLNTDTGCTFAGYWSILRWADVMDSEIYWNRDQVSYGFNWLDKDASYHNYFSQVYPCTLEFPAISATASDTDRESIADRYTTAQADKAVFSNYQFAKLVPKDWGMGDYKYPVWFRFIMAGADTVIHAEPWPYRPTTVGLYDADQGRGKNVSLALEIIPSQDLMTNVLTQILLTIKRNLANVIFYDKNQVSEDNIRDLQGRSNWQYTRMNFVPCDTFKDRIAHDSKREAFSEVRFAPVDVSQMFSTISLVTSMLERLLVISPQEIGASASHQQSKAEVVIVNASTTNRVAYTASFIDEAIEAWKRQAWEALQAYGKAEIVAEVSADIPDLDKHLKELGFEKVGEAHGENKITVKAKKEKLKIDGFFSTRSGPERNNDMATAQAMYQAIMSLNQNQAVAAIADPTSILELMEQAAKLAGADKDFNVRINKDALKSGQLQQVIGEIQKMLMEQVVKDVAKPAAEEMAQQEKVIADEAQKLQTVILEVGRLKQIVDAATQAPPLQPPGMIDQPILPPVRIPPLAEPVNAA